MSTIKGSLIPITPSPDRPKTFNIIYAGAPGSKKTTYMASWPNPLFLYADRNLGILGKLGVPYVPIPDWETWDKKVVPLLRAGEWVDEREEKIPFPYSTVVIDTISSISDLCYDYNAKKWGEQDKSFKFWDRMLSDQMRGIRVVTNMASKGVNVLMGCHLKDKENEVGRVIGTKLDIWGKAAINIVKLFDDVLVCMKETKEDEEEFWVSTVNPERSKIDFVKEIIGHKDGSKLPARVGGSYRELMKAWGIEDG
jgi:hypothetical protein